MVSDSTSRRDNIGQCDARFSAAEKSNVAGGPTEYVPLELLEVRDAVLLLW